MNKGFAPRKLDRKAYYAFLDQVLKTIRRSKGNRQEVELLLRENLNKLDDSLPQILQGWLRARLSVASSQEARRIARNINNFCNDVAQFPLLKPEYKWEIVITGYKEIATVFIEANPKDWVTIQNGLGIAYRHQGKVDEAIAVFKAASNVCSLERFPDKLAMTQNNLGNAYYSLEGEENLDLAKTCYEEALRGTPKHKETCEWAQTKQNLGGVYRKQGKTTEAIICYQDALQIYTQDVFPYEWAKLQNNLGLAFSDQGNIDQALNCLRLSLKILSPTAYPLDCLNTGRNLGYEAIKARRWLEAIQGYSIAIEAVEKIRIWGITDAQRQKVQEAEIDVYIGIVNACIKNGHLTKAIEYVERSKARNLVELLVTRDLYPQGISPEVNDELERQRREIRTEQIRIDIAERNQQVPENRTHLNQLRQQLDEWITEKIKPIDPSFSLTQTVKSISYQQIQELLPDDKTALMEWYIQDDTFVTFTITRQSPGIKIWESCPEDQEALKNLVYEYLTDYGQSSINGWRDNLESRLDLLAKILHIDEIIQHIPKQCDRLILIPHRYLHLLPLHALPLADGDFLCDRFFEGVSYAPSCQLLQLTQQRDRPDFSNLFAIQNPTEDLFYTNLEVEVIRAFFCSAEVLAKQAATKTALNISQNFSSAHCSHFSCHGEFNLALPLESALILANKERLTLGEVFGLNLNQCRLITLSACETGLIDPYSISDEYIGLPSGFLYAGSSSVVSSLWTVNDLSTSLLMIKFYENLRQRENLEDGDVAIALNQAQKWLRNLTLEDFDSFLEQYKPQIEKILAKLRPGQRSLFKESLKQIRQRQPLPFANPYYWAAFIATGV